jgi:hypothetical protein
MNNHGADVEVGRWNQGEDGLRLLFGMSAARPKASCASPAVPTADRLKSNNLARLDRKVLVGFSFSAARHAIGLGPANACRQESRRRSPLTSGVPQPVDPVCGGSGDRDLGQAPMPNNRPSDSETFAGDAPRSPLVDH